MLDKLRSLASDTLVYGTSTVLQRFLTFFLTPLYTNFLGKAELGHVVTLYSLIAFVNVLYSFGFESAFLRFYRKDDEQRFAVYTHAFVSIAAIACLCTLLPLVFTSTAAYLSGVEGNNTTAVIRMAALIPLFDALVLIPFARLRMERKSRAFATLKFITVLINVALNIVFVMGLHWGATGVMIAGIGSSAVGLLMFLPSILRNLRFEWNAELFSDMTAFGLPTLPSGFSAIMLQVADRPILRYLTGDPNMVGEYNACYRLGIPMMLFVSVFEYAWKPFYLSITAESSAQSTQTSAEQGAKSLFARVLTYFTLVCALIFLVVALFIQYVVQLPFLGGRFINEAYWGGLSIVPIVAAAYYFTGLATNFAAGLHINKRTQYLPLATGAAALANVALNFALIPFMGYSGAAWATLGAYAVSAAVMYVYSQRVYPIAYEWKRIGMILAAAMGIYVFALLTTGIAAEYMFIFRVGLVGGFIALLALLGFFSQREVEMIKKLLRRK